MCNIYNCEGEDTNSILDETLMSKPGFTGFYDVEAETALSHIGVGHLDGGHSGRYPWGSGENPFQHNVDFLKYVDDRRRSGFKWTDPETGKVYTGDTAIAKSLNIPTGDFRALYSLTSNHVKSDNYAKALKMREEGASYGEIASALGVKNESTVRTWFTRQNFNKSLNDAEATAKLIKDQIDSQGFIDVGKGSWYAIGVSEKTLNDALVALKLQGYQVYNGRVNQATNPGKTTVLKVAGPPDMKPADAYDYANIHQLGESGLISYDEGKTFKPKFQFPESLDSKRLSVVYAEDGGELKDGVIELRRGVEDLYLGDGVNYSQVRILVDGTHYLKGMAVYADDLPDGIDVRFNTNKHTGTEMLGPDKDHTVLKLVKTTKDENGNKVIDRENPFGSLIKEDGGQREYVGEDGKTHLSLINKRADEGDWSDWSNKIPSQFLSKQSPYLIERQLNLTRVDKQAEFDEIMSIDNPTIKRQLLKSYALDCDKTAETLKAAALPGQRYHVILPLTSLRDDEVYAPNYEDGTKLALVRFPHEGTFQIPVLTVNNKNAEGNQVITKNAKDAIGITKKAADKMSGADFDGDTVITIPFSKDVYINSRPALEDLENFDNKSEYPYYPGMHIMRDTQKQMGVVSNLITDMTLKGADDNEKARAVRHSMTVIDAEKHSLDYKKSFKENGIAELKRKYQGHIGEDGKYHEGASTLISKAKSDKMVPKRVGQPKVNPDGSLSYKTAKDEDLYYTQVLDGGKWKNAYKRKDESGVEGLYFKNSSGKLEKVTASHTTKREMHLTKSTAMAETKDARTLISPENTKTEQTYAAFANDMKALANEARRQYTFEIGRSSYSPDAAKQYKTEVDSLKSKYDVAASNKPKERAAQLQAASEVSTLRAKNPDMTKKEIAKANQRAITNARYQRGIQNRKARQVVIDDKEWEAIQAGAISDSMFEKILNYADMDEVRARATPGRTSEISPAIITRIQAYASSNYTNAEIAKRLGVSTSTVSKYAKGG